MNIKNKCHVLFDAWWKNGNMSRASAYRKLARVMGKRRKDCHFKLFTQEDCILFLQLYESGVLQK